MLGQSIPLHFPKMKSGGILNISLFDPWMIFVSVFFIGLTSVQCDEKDITNLNCEYYLAPSLIPGAGRGIIAGISFLNQSTIEFGPATSFPFEKIRNTQLNNYVYGAELESYSIAVMGASMIFNHRNPKDLDFHYSIFPPIARKEELLEAHSSYTTMMYAARRDISPGEEIFVSYGDNDWFTAREIFLNDTIPENITYDLAELSKVGHCLSHVYVDESTIPLAGKGLFAKKDFSQGEIIYVSPVLSLPKHEITALREESVLINFCLTSPDSDVALMPVGLSAMANHGGKHTNMNLSWHFWPSEEPTVNLRKSADDLVKAPFAQLDLAYTATRDIRAGEELFIFYGEDWERKWWTHLRNLKEWLPDADGGEGMKPLFRHSIEAPAGLFPKWWKSYCVGNTCDDLRATADLNEDDMRKAGKRNLDDAMSFSKFNFSSAQRSRSDA